MGLNRKTGIALILASLCVAIALAEPQDNPLMSNQGHESKLIVVYDFL